MIGISIGLGITAFGWWANRHGYESNISFVHDVFSDLPGLIRAMAIFYSGLLITVISTIIFICSHTTWH